MERRQRLGRSEKGERTRRGWVWSAGEIWARDRKDDGVYVWCGSDRAGQMVSMNRIWPPVGATSAGTWLHPLLPPSSSILTSLHSTPHPPCPSDPTLSKWVALRTLISCHFKHPVSLWIVLLGFSTMAALLQTQMNQSRPWTRTRLSGG